MSSSAPQRTDLFGNFRVASLPYAALRPSAFRAATRLLATHLIATQRGAPHRSALFHSTIFPITPPHRTATTRNVTQLYAPQRKA